MGKKAKPKNKKPSQRWTKYKVEGDKVVRSSKCPRCEFSFLAEHKDRKTCGKCGYSEMNQKPSQKENKDKPKEEKK